MPDYYLPLAKMQDVRQALCWTLHLLSRTSFPLTAGSRADAMEVLFPGIEEADEAG